MKVLQSIPLLELCSPQYHPLAFAAGLFNPGHMQFEADRDKDHWGEPSLEEMVEKALEILKRGPDGFVLYVESKNIGVVAGPDLLSLAI